MKRNPPPLSPQALDLVRALAIAAAREDHARELAQRQEKGQEAA